LRRGGVGLARPLPQPPNRWREVPRAEGRAAVDPAEGGREARLQTRLRHRRRVRPAAVRVGQGGRMKQREFVYRVKVDAALGWELHKGTLAWALVDAAEDEAELAHPGFHGLETDSTDIAVDGGEFVVTFKWTETENPDA